MADIKVGDIIDGKRVTRVYILCGGIAYNTEPVKNAIVDDTAKSVLADDFEAMNKPVKEEPKAEPKAEPKKRTRKK